MLSGGAVRFSCLRLAPESPFLSQSLFSFRRRRFRCSPRFSTSCSAALSDKKQKVIVISGPTGAGKSKLALELAKRLNGDIISADSVQVYRGLDIGSAKPSLADRKEVKHHLIDILHPSEDYSVGQFFYDARQATKDVLHGGRVPIVVGGTGLYLRWFIYGKPDVPKSSEETASVVASELAELERDGDWDAGVEMVVKAGDTSAVHLAANDWYRLRRKLEIIKASGSPPSAFEVPYDAYKDSVAVNLSSHDTLDYDFLCFFLTTPRLDLYRSIDYRCEEMLVGNDNNLLLEARSLLDLGLLPNSNSATRAIGYRQAMEYLVYCKEHGGRSTPEDVMFFLSTFQTASRNFAKRQLTWFRNEHKYHWIDASKPMEQVLDFIHDSYQSEDGSSNIKIPESLCMKKDAVSSSKFESSQLKAYRTKNRRFVRRGDCSEILEWIQMMNQNPSSVVC